MPSSYTPSLRLEIQATGENDTSWGDKTNVNFASVLEPAIAGAAVITMQDAEYILSVGYSAADEARNAIIICGGANTATRNVICPASTKVYVVRNLTSGSHPIVFKTATGSGVTIASGETVSVMCDGTRVMAAYTVLDGTVLPAKISQATTNTWRFNGALGLNRAQPIVPNYGVFALDGVTGSYIPFYVNGVHKGSVAASEDSFDISSLNEPITFATGGTTRMTIALGGNIIMTAPINATLASFSSTVTAIGLVSTVVSNAPALLVKDTANTDKGRIVWNEAGWGLTNADGSQWALRVNAGTTNLYGGGSLTVASGITATTGTFSSALSATTGTFSSALSATAGTFSGALSAPSADISGAVSAQTVTVSGTMSGLTVTQTSDERQKANWRALPDDIISKVAAIDKAGVFDWHRGGESIGIGAQSLEALLPQGVHTDAAGNKSVNYGGVALALIVELCREVEQLRRKV